MQIEKRYVVFTLMCKAQRTNCGIQVHSSVQLECIWGHGYAELVSSVLQLAVQLKLQCAVNA